MSEKVTQPWFDEDEGVLLIGEEAVQRRFEEGATALVPFIDLLDDPEFDVEDFKFIQKLKPTDQSIEDCYNYGAWLTNLVVSRNPSDELTRQHVDRAATLGVGVAWRHISELTGHDAFRQYRAPSYEASSRSVLLKDWENDRFYALAAELHAKLKRKLTLADFDDYAVKDPEHRPTGRFIQNRIRVGSLNEFLGYPDFASWRSAGKFTYWGVQVMLANDGIELTPTILELYSGESKGPSVVPIKAACGSWANFKKNVVNEYYLQLQWERDLRAKVRQYRKIGEEEGFPMSIRTLSGIELVKASAKYMLVREVTQSTNGKLEKFAHLPMRELMNVLVDTKPFPTTEFIEAESRKLNLFSDLAFVPVKVDRGLSINAIIMHNFRRGGVTQELRAAGLSTAATKELTSAVLAISDPVRKVFALKNLAALAADITLKAGRLDD